MNKSAKLLLFYCTLLTLFLIVSAFVANPSPKTLISQIFILPIAVYFIASSLKQIRKSKDEIAPFKLNSKNFMYVLIIFMILTATSLVNVLGNSKNSNSTENIPVERSQEGEVSFKFGSKVTPTETHVISKTNLVVRLNGEVAYLNIRSGPSTSNDIIGEAGEGEIFEYVETEKQWYKIVLEKDDNSESTESGEKKKFGWVHANYVEIMLDSEEESEN